LRVVGERAAAEARADGLAGAPRVPVNSEGSSEVGISWPTSASRLAVPIPRTPGVSQPFSAGAGGAS